MGYGIGIAGGSTAIGSRKIWIKFDRPIKQAQRLVVRLMVAKLVKPLHTA